jgi:lysophospholipase L1-like esterase
VALGIVFTWPVPPTSAAPALPDSIAAIGDSITRATNACCTYGDHPSQSWSTGLNPLGPVNSHYERLILRNPTIWGDEYNDARAGAKMAAANDQAALAVSQGADYVTILMGANDVCTSSVSTMTPTATLEAQLQTAVQTLSTGSPNARIYVVSIPNVYHLWEILHTNFSAVITWTLGGICQSLLANPTSTAPADVALRQQVYQRTVDDNAALARVCARFIHCRFDGNAAFNLQFVPADVSTRDYFHPSVSGQARAAAVTWAAGFDFTDQVAPTSNAVSDAGAVTIDAIDNVAVAGIEYSLDDGPYQRYSGTFVVAPGTNVTYRAVDVNGNIEATKTVIG